MKRRWPMGLILGFSLGCNVVLGSLLLTAAVAPDREARDGRSGYRSPMQRIERVLEEVEVPEQQRAEIMRVANEAHEQMRTFMRDSQAERRAVLERLLLEPDSEEALAAAETFAGAQQEQMSAIIHESLRAAARELTPEQRLAMNEALQEMFDRSRWRRKGGEEKRD